MQPNTSRRFLMRLVAATAVIAAALTVATGNASAAPVVAEGKPSIAKTSSVPMETQQAWGAWQYDQNNYRAYRDAAAAAAAFVQFARTVGYYGRFQTRVVEAHEWVHGGVFVLVYRFNWRYFG
ncbi:hypothetical protein [Lentzea sp. HUAS12]|uniref:hypothetical protein n=1 Tax=Lentzea sp. HUAS12 TaxID=2951806 RepID=UPI00209D3643|nr:hypothetical protein [Lentzea sp. HUAS12]USX56319.1 hypothetical protein ND450_20115 [Lentzea sp. HUAS12]